MNLGIIPLGSGGAFDIIEKNSAIYFTFKGKNILIDCGYTVYPELKKLNLISKIDYIFASHLHDDHIGSLSTLIFDRWYLSGLKTEIVCQANVGEKLEYYLSQICMNEPNQYNISNSYPDVEIVDTTNAHVKGLPTSGFVFRDGKDVFIYSGDIAESFFSYMDSKEVKALDPSNTLVYHECSSADFVGNVHCYYKKIKDYGYLNIVGYHHNKEAAKTISADSNIMTIHD